MIMKTNTIINVALKLKNFLYRNLVLKIGQNGMMKLKVGQYGRNSRNKGWLYNTNTIIKK